MKEIKKIKLHEAVLDGDIELVKKLIDNGVDVNEKDDNLFTSLHYASQEFTKNDNCLEIAKILLNSGIDIDSKDSYGNTALFRAVANFRGNPNMIKLLLENGADKFNENDYGVSPYALAETIANYPVLQYLK